MSVDRPRWVRRIVVYMSNPVYVIGALAVAFLLYTIFVPFLRLIVGTFTWQVGDTRLFPDATVGRPTIAHWKEVFSSDLTRAVFVKPFLHSLSIALSVSLLSLMIGGSIAWLVTRTNMPGRRIIGLLIVIPYIIPSWIKSLSWQVVFKNRTIGGSPGLLEYLLGIGPPDWVSYGFLPITVTLTEHSYVFFYLLMASALSSMNSNLEEAATIMGASRWTTLRKITFPAVLPALLSGFVLTFSNSLGAFGTAEILGLPVRYYTLSTMLYNSIDNRMTSVAHVLSLVLVLFSSVLVWANQRTVGRRRSFAVVTGRASRQSQTALGKWRLPALGFCVFFLLTSGLLPMLLLIWQSLMLQDGNYSPMNLTLHYWIGESDPLYARGLEGVLKSPIVWTGLKHSLQVALSTASISSVLGLLFGYVVVKGRPGWISKTVDQLSFLPYLFPGIALSAIYLAMFAQPRWPLPALYGTMAIVVLISVINQLPFATRAGASTIHLIGGELEEAAIVCGASWLRRFARILVPIGRKGLVSAFLISFISAMKSMNLILLLVTPRTSTLTTITFAYTEKGYQQYAAALVLIIIVVILVTYYATVALTNADLSRGLGMKS